MRGAAEERQLIGPTLRALVERAGRGQGRSCRVIVAGWSFELVTVRVTGGWMTNQLWCRPFPAGRSPTAADWLNLGAATEVIGVPSAILPDMQRQLADDPGLVRRALHFVWRTGGDVG